MNLGINGSGFFENLDEPTKKLIKDLDSMYIRVPGGAISRFHSPYSVRKGWGLTAEAVNYFFDNYEVDYEEDDPNGGKEKWLQKVNEQPDYSYLDSLIGLSNEMPGLKVIYVVNVFTSNLDEQINTINYLIENGVRVEIVEFGNEVYGKYNFNPANYISFCQPVINKLKELHPSIKVSLISGNFKGRRDHAQWNESLAAHVNDPANKVDYVTLHFYIGDDLAPNAYAALPAPKVVDYSKVDNDLQEACENYIQEVILSGRFAEEIASAESIYTPRLIVTEWNNNPAQKWCNTLVNGMWIFDSYVSLQSTKVDVLCLHNGVSPDIYGAICRKKQQDDTTLEMVPRVSYFTLALVNEYYKSFPNATQLEPDWAEKTIMLPETPGKFVVPFINLYEDTLYLNYDESKVNYTTIEIYSVEGDYLYSSAGATGFQAKNQPKNLEIAEMQYKSFDLDPIKLLPNSYGFVVITTVAVEPVHLPPIADAGDDKKYVYKTGAGVGINLDASRSYSDGELKAVTWKLKNTDKTYSGINVTTEPYTEGVYTFVLTIEDAKGLTSTDEVQHTVKKRKGFFNFNFKSSARVLKVPKT